MTEDEDECLRPWRGCVVLGLDSCSTPFALRGLVLCVEREVSSVCKPLVLPLAEWSGRDEGRAKGRL